MDSYKEHFKEEMTSLFNWLNMIKKNFKGDYEEAQQIMTLLSPLCKMPKSSLNGN